MIIDRTFIEPRTVISYDKEGDKWVRVVKEYEVVCEVRLINKNKQESETE